MKREEVTSHACCIIASVAPHRDHFVYYTVAKKRNFSILYEELCMLRNQSRDGETEEANWLDKMISY
jgi:hypothetical protein